MERVIKINQSETVVGLKGKLAAIVIKASPVTRYISVTISFLPGPMASRRVFQRVMLEATKPSSYSNVLGFIRNI